MMSIARKCIERIKFRNKLRRMDDEWFFRGGSCWELFPPSFYYTHTKQEIKRIKEELYEMIE